MALGWVHRLTVFGVWKKWLAQQGETYAAANAAK
jgi:hypothetical protein